VVHEAASIGFGRAVDAYDRGRPRYPDVAVTWLWQALRLAAGSRVVDVGAGTGKLTAALVARGAEVSAVEPVQAMRERLAASVAARVLDGTAERLPVDDGWAAAVVAGQAFHWFANDRALAEFHRASEPGARLGLIWNRRELGDPLQAALSELLEPYRGDAPRFASGAWREVLERTELFEPVGSEVFRFVQELTVEGLVDRVASTSFIAALDERPRAELVGAARRLGERHAPVRLPYTSDVYVYARASAPHGRHGMPAQ
jgi:SAM-dependent methyltransferase